MHRGDRAEPLYPQTAAGPPTVRPNIQMSDPPSDRSDAPPTEGESSISLPPAQSDASFSPASPEPPPPKSLRRRAAEGTIVNSVFQVGLAGVGLLQRLVVAAFLTTTEFGLWGIVLTVVLTLWWLKQIGIADKYIQQSEPDQEAAFQKAFTLELAVSLVFFALVAVLMPVFAAAYGHSELIVPGIVLAASVPITAFETPIWISYRRLQYVRQRLLSAVNPISAFVVTVILAVAGAGYWSLVLGVVAGSIAGATVAVITSPYKVRLRYERATIREYASFSWPLVGFAVSNLIIVQGTLLIANQTVGLAGVGAIALAASIVVFTDRVDAVISQTIYPIACRVADRRELLHEAFVKSNRLVLLWAVPFGVGLALFAGDLINYVFGDKWREAEEVLVGVGLIAAVSQIAFNWSVFLRAVDETKPMFYASVIGLLSFFVFSVPALLMMDLTGYVVGFGAITVVQIFVRGYFLRRLFHGFEITTHMLRAFAPTLVPVAAVFLVRLLSPDDDGLPQAIGEFVLYLALVVGCTLLFERRLVGEMIGYLRKRAQEPPPQNSDGRAVASPTGA